MSELIMPNPHVGWFRRTARACRRQWVLFQRNYSHNGIKRKQLNTELNQREFWHGCTHLQSRPRLIQVGTNWNCNLRCMFCRLNTPATQLRLQSLSQNEKEISPKVFKAVKALLPTAEMMVLTPLGEPLLWSQLDEILEFHAKLGSRNLALTTNGMLLTESTCKKLIRSSLSHLYCSIDSNDPEIYAQMRVGGNLKKVEAGIRRLIALRDAECSEFPHLTVNATFLKRNLPQLPSMVEWATKLGFEELSIQLMEIETPALANEFLGNEPNLTRDYVTQALEAGREHKIVLRLNLAIENLFSANALGRDVHRHMASTSTNSDQIPPDANLLEKCQYPWENIMIDVDGDVRSCCWARGSLGNLNNQSFDEIWNGPQAVAMRKAFLKNILPQACRKTHCRIDL